MLCNVGVKTFLNYGYFDIGIFLIDILSKWKSLRRIYASSLINCKGSDRKINLGISTLPFLVGEK